VRAVSKIIRKTSFSKESENNNCFENDNKINRDLDCYQLKSMHYAVISIANDDPVSATMWPVLSVQSKARDSRILPLRFACDTDTPDGILTFILTFIYNLFLQTLFSNIALADLRNPGRLRRKTVTIFHPCLSFIHTFNTMILADFCFIFLYIICCARNRRCLTEEGA
jgi:hypothetical protein